ncbi:MAG TPA: FlgD immunoglobulin-like domain containing protein [Candidatus Krumholzibacterium sp.]|nr:FlgD immunoglobulin-like domain containing protein [Candidatus Krumholzibacterium sp.]
MARSIFRAMLICGIVLFISGSPLLGAGSIQLVGNFAGINCEPGDIANDMDSVGVDLWRKLKFIDEPGDPDTIFFKFTADNSYMPEHWGWSFTYGWGIADLAWSPPSIAAVLPDSGYWYFHFNEATFEYWLDRPDAAVAGTVRSDQGPAAPDGTRISLFDTGDRLVGTFDPAGGTTFDFSPLPEGEFYLTAMAPGFKDTLVTGIVLTAGQTGSLDITLTSLTAVMISSATTEDVPGGIVLSWITACCDPSTAFDVYRGTTPRFEEMTRRNAEPVMSSFTEFRYFDECDDRDIDHYYYIVELGPEDGTVFGPVLSPATLPLALSGLGQNYPNPFNPVTTIPYYVSRAESDSKVTIAFYDVTGKVVDRYDLGFRPAGDHRFEWNPSLSTGRDIPSGVYYCRLTVGKEVFTRKMIMLR